MSTYTGADIIDLSVTTPVENDTPPSEVNDAIREIKTVYKNQNATIVKSTNYTLTSTDSLVLVSGNTTITIPESSGVSSSAFLKQYTIIKTDSSATTVTIARSGSDTFNGATSQTLKIQYSGAILFGSGVVDWKAVFTSPITFGNDTTKFLRDDGTMAIPPTSDAVITNVTAATYAITAAQCNGNTTLTNSGAGATTVAFTLPAVENSYKIDFIVIDGGGITLTPDGSNTINGRTSIFNLIYKPGFYTLLGTSNLQWLLFRTDSYFENLWYKGYIMGGDTGANTYVIEDLIFSNETSQAISAILDTAKHAGTGVNSSSKGYIMGGSAGALSNVIEDLIFINETSQAISATLDTAKNYGPGVNSSSKGYIMGGNTGAATNVIEDLIFSNETSQAIAATLDTAKSNGTGVNSSSKGYIMGGNTGSLTNVIEDLIFSNETSQAISATLDTAKSSGTGVNSSSKGYIMGGNTTNVIEDLIFSNETSQVISATLDTGKSFGAGVQYGSV